MSDAYVLIGYSGPYLPKTYEPLIFSSWLRTLRYGNEHLRDVKASAYYPRYHAYITSVLADPKCEVRLAVLEDDHDIVLGYSVSRGTSLDFVWVQKEQRLQGIGKKLVPEGVHDLADPLTPFRET